MLWQHMLPRGSVAFEGEPTRVIGPNDNLDVPKAIDKHTRIFMFHTRPAIFGVLLLIEDANAICIASGLR